MKWNAHKIPLILVCFLHFSTRLGILLRDAFFPFQRVWLSPREWGRVREKEREIKGKEKELLSSGNRFTLVGTGAYAFPPLSFLGTYPPSPLRLSSLQRKGPEREKRSEIRMMNPDKTISISPFPFPILLYISFPSLSSFHKIPTNKIETETR